MSSSPDTTSEPTDADGLSTVDRVLVVDDERNVVSALRRALRPQGFEVLTAFSGEEAMEILAREPVDAIVCDMRMPGISGAEVLRESRVLAPDAVRILLTGYADVSATVKAVNEGEIFRFMVKPWEDVILVQGLREGLERRALLRERDALEQLTLHQNEELRRLNEGLEKTVSQRTAHLDKALANLETAGRQLREDFSATVRLLSSLIASRSGLSSHCPPRIARMLRPVGPLLGLTAQQINDVVFAALLQDIGKLSLKDELLRRPLVAMTGEERATVLKHPGVAVAHLAALPSLAPAALVLGSLYENFDGSGIPGKRSGTDIPLGARLLRVITDYVHMLEGVMDWSPLSDEAAVRHLRRFRGTVYDPACLDAFLRSVNQPVAQPATQALVSTQNLRPGMCLSKDLFASTGTLLLAQGQILDEALIHHIRRFEECAEDFLWITVVHDDGHAITLDA